MLPPPQVGLGAYDDLVEISIQIIIFIGFITFNLKRNNNKKAPIINNEGSIVNNRGLLLLFHIITSINETIPIK